MRLEALTAAWAIALLAAGCGGGDDDADVRDAEGADHAGETETASPAPGTGDWYRPAVDVTWQWQLSGELNASYDVDIYDVDLFETMAEAIGGLQAEGRRVLCYLSAGSAEEWRPDYGDFEPTVLGKPLDEWPGEVWIDIRSSDVREILAARLDLARDKGCDGVEPDNVDGWDNDTGFSLTKADQLDFDRWLADEAHGRGLFVALKNAGGIAGALEPWFDLSLNEECHAFAECAELAVFTGAGKPILNAEYAGTAADAEALAVTLCPAAEAASTRTLILPLELDDAFRVACF